jgi:hypothetical protein
MIDLWTIVVQTSILAPTTAVDSFAHPKLLCRQLDSTLLCPEGAEQHSPGQACFALKGQNNIAQGKLALP